LQQKELNANLQAAGINLHMIAATLLISNCTAWLQSAPGPNMHCTSGVM